MDIPQLKSACDKTITHLESIFMRLQLGRASSGLVSEIHVHVTSRGMDQNMSQIANISTMDPQTLKIEPWDKKVLADIEKAIYDAHIGLTPQNQWDYILVKVPQLTEERRKELSKVVTKDGEDAKITIRNHRHDARKTLDLQLKAEEISKDEKTGKENEIDEITKKYNDEIERMVTAKSDEVMKI